VIVSPSSVVEIIDVERNQTHVYVYGCYHRIESPSIRRLFSFWQISHQILLISMDMHNCVCEEIQRKCLRTEAKD